ncbi:hypothetical protein GN109_23285 [Collimonas pratensis]|uniref:hypothetical protein n=1 Tax=Collimonas pratensis TaxID=279113 RepID=UPI00143D251A|nr:hypothetical protein [Collimonas pratensis]NKI72354.1 hypothetical protein [Collimonas pratensis]
MNTIEFTTRAGNIVVIEADDSGEKISVTRDALGVGHIEFRFVEGDPPMTPNSYHITDLALPEFKREGIGRRCLQLHKEIFESPITAGPEDGSRPSDGSYLIDDGPGFVAKMRSEGLICPISDN